MSEDNYYDNQYCNNDIMDDYMIISSDYIVQEFEKQQKEKVDLDSFTLLTVVGKGSYAKVVLVRKKDNDKIYAMKILKKAYIQKKKQTTHIKTERQVLAEIIHPSIVKLAYAFQNQKKLFFVLDYCPGGELFNLLSKKKRFTEDQIRFYAGQIVVAVEYLHSKDIVYRDLKPENVLIDKDGYIKLTDFGLSKRLKGNQGAAYSICGTPEYLAPEILERVGHGKPVDWWTLGAIMYEMLTGLPPFYTENRKELFERIKHQQLKYPSYISLELKDLLEKLFDKNQFKRLGSNKGDDIKKHPFFKSLDFQKLMEKKIEPPFIPQLKNEVDVSYFDTCFTETAVYSQKEEQIQQPESQEELYYEDFSFQKSMSCSSKEKSNLNQYQQKQTNNDKNYSMVTSIEGGSISDNQFKQDNNQQFFLNVQQDKPSYNKNYINNNQQYQYGGYNNNNYYQDNYQLETSIDGISYQSSNGVVVFDQNSQKNNTIMEIEEYTHQNNYIK